MEDGNMTVRMFIRTSTKRLTTVRYGVALWLVEYVLCGTPVTRQGFIHCEQTNELELALKALINAFTKLRKPCTVLIYCDCGTVLNAFQNSWFVYWQKEDWTKLNGKPVKYPELWEMLVGRIEPHIYTMRGGGHDYTEYMKNEIRRELEKWET